MLTKQDCNVWQPRYIFDLVEMSLQGRSTILAWDGLDGARHPSLPVPGAPPLLVWYIHGSKTIICILGCIYRCEICAALFLHHDKDLLFQLFHFRFSLLSRSSQVPWTGRWIIFLHQFKLLFVPLLEEFHMFHEQQMVLPGCIIHSVAANWSWCSSFSSNQSRARLVKPKPVAAEINEGLS